MKTEIDSLEDILRKLSNQDKLDYENLEQKINMIASSFKKLNLKKIDDIEEINKKILVIEDLLKKSEEKLSKSSKLILEFKKFIEQKK